MQTATYLLALDIPDPANPVFPIKLVEYGIVGAVVAGLLWLVFWQYKTIREQIAARGAAEQQARLDLRDFVKEHRSELTQSLSAMSQGMIATGHEMSSAVDRMTVGLHENSKALSFLGIFVQTIVRLVGLQGGGKLEQRDIDAIVRSVKSEMSNGG